MKLLSTVALLALLATAGTAGTAGTADTEETANRKKCDELVEIIRHDADALDPKRELLKRYKSLECKCVVDVSQLRLRKGDK